MQPVTDSGTEHLAGDPLHSPVYKQLWASRSEPRALEQSVLLKAGDKHTGP